MLNTFRPQTQSQKPTVAAEFGCPSSRRRLIDSFVAAEIAVLAHLAVSAILVANESVVAGTVHHAVLNLSGLLILLVAIGSFLVWLTLKQRYGSDIGASFFGSAAAFILLARFAFQDVLHHAHCYDCNGVSYFDSNLLVLFGLGVAHFLVTIICFEKAPRPEPVASVRVRRTKVKAFG